VLIGKILVEENQWVVVEVKELDMITDTAIDVHLKLGEISFIFRRDDMFGNRLYASDSQYISELECLANNVVNSIRARNHTEVGLSWTTGWTVLVVH